MAMLDWESLEWWILAYIIAPLAVAPLGLLTIRLVPPNPGIPPGATRLIALFKDGQLGWIVIGITCAVFYDLWEFGQGTGTLFHELFVVGVALFNEGRTDIAKAVFTRAQELKELRTPPGWIHTLVVCSGIIICSFWLASSVGAAIPTPIHRQPLRTLRAFMSHYKILAWTAFFGFLDLMACITMHVWMITHAK
jgi:hypothetical protein